MSKHCIELPNLVSSFQQLEQLISATATKIHNYFTDKWIMNDAQIDINYFVTLRDTLNWYRLNILQAELTFQLTDIHL